VLFLFGFYFIIILFFYRTDWLYSQKYDRQNASIKRSIERSVSTRSIAGAESESAA
jgi:hypothetical protein